MHTFYIYCYQGNGKMTSYGSETFEKHDFNDLVSNTLDATEKDDSKEKENENKDEIVKETSPLDMIDNKEETKVNIGDENMSDSAPLLDKEYDKSQRMAEEGRKSINEQEKGAKERRKGEGKNDVISLKGVQAYRCRSFG